ncbi:hypothetical protein MSG28_008854 [Choristoneura fumiferana]|uniref:Uncharacterized protein n=1 Tax=Choristoneura fumiferana TaxID=7141 RepID=A0ACC0J896_CHOFU|nr:hypothetical protein MSG28_008854 [Choristoneura fumiferana]
MPVTITQTHRGPSALLSYLFTGSKNEETNEDTVIDNLVAVSAKLQFNDKLCFIAYKKLNTEENVEIELSVTCEDPSFNAKWICTEDSSDWREIGTLCNNNILDVDGYYVYTCHLKIHVSVRKIEKSTLCAQMFLDADFTDFSLSASNGSVAVHKIVMACHSDVFKAMLNGEWKENVEGRVEVKGATRQSLDHLKDYMYLDILPDEGLGPLLLLASYYMIENLKTRCIGKMAHSVKSDNLYELLDFACLNNIPELAYEILHVTPSEVVNKAYKSKKESKIPKSEGNDSDNK